jgi:type I restriction enzyme S subunit
MTEEHLGNICDFNYGESLREDRRQPGKVPVYGSNGIVGWHNQAVTKGPAIIIGRKGSIGEVHFSAVPCWPIDTTYYVDLAKKECDLRWLYHALVALDLRHLNKAAAVPGLNREDAYRKRVIFPPLAEQKRIAAILEKADRLRRMRRYAGQLSDTLLQSVFLEMFGNHVQRRGWKRCSVAELCKTSEDVKCGPFGTQLSKSEFRTMGVPLWGIKHVNADFRVRTDEFLERKKAAELSQYSLKPGDIVMTRKGTVGNCAIYPDSYPNGIMHSDLLRLRVDATNSVGSFVAAQFRFSPKVEHQVSLVSSGAIMEGINVTKLKEIVVEVPPFPLQQKFAAIVRRFERLRVQQREAERQADHLFQTLLHRAFPPPAPFL